MPNAEVDGLLKRATSWLLVASVFTFSPKRRGDDDTEVGLEFANYLDVVVQNWAEETGEDAGS